VPRHERLKIRSQKKPALGGGLPAGSAESIGFQKEKRILQLGVAPCKEKSSTWIRLFARPAPAGLKAQSTFWRYRKTVRPGTRA